jgi:hypothetical protein
MRLNIILYNETELIDAFIKVKKMPTNMILSSIKDTVVDACKNYKVKAINCNFESINPIGYANDEKKALIGCYEIDTKTKKELLKKIIDAQSEFYKFHCPYCGLYHISTFDHYLPKDKFSEFSFLPINLLPCCSQCNTKKNDIWIANGQRLFMNRYFDDDDIGEYLRCTTTIEGNKLKYEFDLDNNLLNNTTLGTIIKTHFFKLNLLEKYKENANNYISEQFITYKSFLLDDSSKLKSAIEKEYEQIKNRDGMNSWKAAILRAFKSSDFMIDWIYNYLKS